MVLITTLQEFILKTIHRYKEKWEKSLEEPPYCSSSCKNCKNKYENHGCTRGIFEELGWNYIGPIDGHNIQQLIEVIDNLKNLEGPQFLHIITKKGAGFNLAEKIELNIMPFQKIKVLKVKKLNIKIFLVSGLLTWHQ